MNIGIHKRPRVSTLLTTIYFAGMLVSASLMAVHAIELWYTVVAATFFSGTVALYFTARLKEEIVVYLDKKEEVVVKEERTDRRSQLEGVILDTGDPQQALNRICEKLEAGQGAIYAWSNDALSLKYSYATSTQDIFFKPGEGLVGRVFVEKKTLYIDDLPEGYITVFSGLGNASPTKLALIPINDGVIEIATFNGINESTLKHIEASCTEVLR